MGDVDIEYRLNDDGTFTMNFFNETNTSSVTSQGQYTQGVSLHYQETFDFLELLFQKPYQIVFVCKQIQYQIF